MHELADGAHLVPRHTRHRIEIDTKFIRMIEVVRAHRVRMQFQAREIGHPGECGGVARHHLIGAAAGRKRR